MKSKFKKSAKDVILNYHYTCYKKSARNRKLSFELCFGEFRSLVEGRCAYCGIGPYYWIKKDKRKAKLNGVDRMDNKKGYTSGNSVTCCKYCNQAKSDKTIKIFFEWVRSVYEYSCIKERR